MDITGGKGIIRKNICGQFAKHDFQNIYLHFWQTAILNKIETKCYLIKIVCH